MSDAIHTLKLIVEKADKLERLKFTRYLYAGGKIGISGSASDEGFVIERQGPDDEAIDAFVLTLRFFVQNNESTSFANIEKLFSTLPLEPARIDAIVNSRRVINDYLDHRSHIVVSGETLTRRCIFEVFLWGGLAHANPEKKKVYDGWTARPDLFLAVQMEFTDILVTLLQGIFWFRQASREALAILDTQAQGRSTEA